MWTQIMRGLHFPSQQDYVKKKTMNSTKGFMGKYFENAPMCFHFLGKKYKKLTLMKARLCERKEQNRIEEPFIVIVHVQNYGRSATEEENISIVKGFRNT